jgi:hypothetical protein
VSLCDLRQVSGMIAGLFVGIGPISFRVGAVTPSAIVLVLLNSGRFGGEDIRDYRNRQNSGQGAWQSRKAFTLPDLPCIERNLSESNNILPDPPT